MSSPEFPPHDGGEELSRPPAEPAAPADVPEDSSLLDQVVRETISAADTDEPLDPEQMDALLSVARRHRGQPFALAPVATDLVRSIVDTRFHSAIADQNARQQMAQQIAETLVNTEATCERLRRMWTRLCEAVT